MDAPSTKPATYGRIATGGPRRLLASGLAVVCLLGGSRVGAGMPRAAALGGGDYFEDAHATVRWPGSLPDYAGRWWLGTGSFNPHNGYKDDRGRAYSAWEVGGYLPLDRDGAGTTLGVAFNGRAVDSDPGSLLRDNTGISALAMVGRRLGPVQVTVLWRRSVGDVDDGSGGTSYHHERQDWGAGLRFDLSESAYLDVAVDRRRRRDRAVLAASGGGTVSTGELTAGPSWGVRSRAFVAVGTNTTLTPVIDYLREDAVSPMVGGTRHLSRAFSTDGHHLRMELGLIQTPDPDRLYMVAVSRSSVSAHHADPGLAGPPAPAYDDDHAVWEAHLALERRLYWWLSLRCGLSWEHLEVRSGDGGLADRDHGRAAAGATVHLGDHGLSIAVANRAPRGPAGLADLDPPTDTGPWFNLGYHRDY